MYMAPPMRIFTYTRIIIISYIYINRYIYINLYISVYLGREPTGVVGIIPTANIQHFNPKVKSFDKYFYFGCKIFAAIATYSMGNP